MKKHHKLLLWLTAIGVIFLLYLWYKHRSTSGGVSSGAVDTSQYPTIISTGGGSISPSIPNFAPQTFNVQSPDTSALMGEQSSPAQASVMPGTSQSGVPAYSNAAQEFNTKQPIATPSPSISAPSYYQSAQALPYQQLNSQYVQATSTGMPGTTSVADLQSYLANNVNAFEITADLGIGNQKTAGVDYQTAAQVQQNLTSEGANYCAEHPEACGPDQASVIQNLVNSYSNFIGAASSRQAGEIAASQNPGGIQGPAQTGTPVFNQPTAQNPLGSWTLAQSTSTPNTSEPTQSRPVAQAPVSLPRLNPYQRVSLQ